ncbi:MAG: hypothetical protein ACK4GK_07220 [Ferrovibrio sp.]
MRARYIIRLREPIQLEDHWPVPMVGGELRAISDGKQTTAFEAVFCNQPTSLSPKIAAGVNGGPHIITKRDNLLPFITAQLERAFSYLQCYFDIEILIKEVDVEYAAEREEEKEAIDISSMSTRRTKTIPLLPFDMITRSIMAAESGDAPRFEATLASAARTALIQERYIDGFRYSFLLIESLYGNGKFKSEQLKQALSENQDFRAIVQTAVSECVMPKQFRNSDTEALLASSPSVDQVIEHLVDKRGFYFHGNRKRKDAWLPHDQEQAEALALLAVEIAGHIAHAAASPIFIEELQKRHYDNAKNVGAIMSLKVEFTFHDPTHDLKQSAQMNISVPGTKLTPKMATYVARQFLDRFSEGNPVANLIAAKCTVAGTEQPVFSMSFAEPD